jgi:tetratricopeptide (TPR) repeat protein
MNRDQRDLQDAFNLSQQGQLAEASSIFEQLLKRNPNNHDALHFFGILKAKSGHVSEARQLLERSLATKVVNLPYVENYASILFQIGDYRQAVTVCEQAIRNNGKTETLQYVLAISLHKLGRLDEALRAFASLLASYPNHLAGINEKASTLAELQRYDEALACVEKALQINPRYAESFLAKGNLFAKLKRYDDAIGAFKTAVALNANLLDAYLGMANVLRELGRYDEALPAYDKVLALRPNDEGAWLGRGNLLTDLRRFDDALAAYDKVLTFKPGDDGAWLGRGNVFAELRRLDDALAAYDKALLINPGVAKVWLGRGNALTALKRNDEAFAAYEKALALDPGLAEAWLGRGNLLAEDKRFDEACAAYDKAIALDPQIADAYCNKALIKLGIGDFEEGWDLYEWRSKTKINIPKHAYLKSLNFLVRQNRAALIGESVAILAEQGIGDEIMFASILPDLIGDAKSVAYEVDARLLRLFESAFPSVSLIARDDQTRLRQQAPDVVLQVGSLGYAYRRDAKSFPRLPYLRADAVRVEKWQALLADEAMSRKTIGISWRGGTSRTRRDERSIELEQLRPLIEGNDCHFVSLQYGEVADEIARFNDAGARKVHCPLDDFNNFDDFAALVTALDLVVSVQNTTIHMCGALGRPCWGMIPWRPEWRYGVVGESMIWYSSIKLYRHSAPGDWDGIIKAINSDLRECAAPSRR